MPKTPKVEADDAELDARLAAVAEPVAEPVFPEPVEVTAPVTPAKNPNEIAQEKEAERVAGLEAEKKAFVEKVMAARKPEEKPIVVQPVSPAMVKQREAEMAAGRRMNEHYEQFHKAHPQPKGPVDDTKHTAVFRPADYVPDQKKGQGNVEAHEVK